MIDVRVLASGSSGNSVFVRCNDTRLLFDCGISTRRITKALQEIGEDPTELDALFLTHEHIDHINALPVLGRKHGNLNVFATKGTLKDTRRRLKIDLQGNVIAAGQPVRLRDFCITPFATSHDGFEPVGYRIEAEGCAMAVATDLGFAPRDVTDSLAGCRLIVLEANHNEEMLKNGPYPAFLKRRIASKRGHLSNRQTCELVRKIDSTNLEHIILAHLSEENNTPEQALSEVGAALNSLPKIELTVAARHQPGPLYRLDGEGRETEVIEDPAARQCHLPFAKTS